MGGGPGLAAVRSGTETGCVQDPEEDFPLPHLADLDSHWQEAYCQGFLATLTRYAEEPPPCCTCDWCQGHPCPTSLQSSACRATAH